MTFRLRAGSSFATVSTGMTELEQQLNSLRAEADAAIASCADLPGLDQLKGHYLGRQGR